jgi:hypothetical protein
MSIDLVSFWCSLFGHKWSKWLDNFLKKHYLSKRHCSRCGAYQIYNHKNAILKEFWIDNELIESWDIAEEPFMLDNNGLIPVFFNALFPIFGILMGIIAIGGIFFHFNKDK